MAPCATEGCDGEARYLVIVRDSVGRTADHERAYCPRCWWLWQGILRSIAIEETTTRLDTALQEEGEAWQNRLSYPVPD